MLRPLFSLLLLLACAHITAQQSRLATSSLNNAALPIRCVGPSVMSGRVVDIEVNPQNPHHFYAAFATGGLWVTHNNGQSFDPLFQHEAVITIGDIAVDWKSETIWVGTGENNSSRSSYAGAGIYKSTDLGKTWSNMGLSESHHIGRILINPTNSNEIWVAALGHLYTPNKERGIYHSTDSGASWTQRLFIDANTGAIDLVMDPLDPNVLYAAFWEKERKAWNFSESGTKSGIYATYDHGKSWSNIIEKQSVFPNNSGTGRIGLAIHHSSEHNILYALVDNQNHQPEKTDSLKKSLKKNDFLTMNTDQFLKLDTVLLDQFLQENGFPEQLNRTYITAEIKKGKITPIALYDYVYDANKNLFETPVYGAELYSFSPQTKTWTKTHTEPLNDVFYTYGYYFGMIRVSPNDHSVVYIAGVPLLKSTDGGATFKNANPDNVHVDHHALWINPNNPNHIINGSDGGVQISYDGGEHFTNCNHIPVAQSYAVAADNADPYHIYTGLQDNGVWFAPNNCDDTNPGWHITGHNCFKEITGGDGMQIQVDPRDHTIVYTGYQFGHYTKYNLKTGDQLYIHPSHELGEKPLRWNWQSPILLSSYNADIFYICSNKVHRSTDGGISFQTISGDLTHGFREGDVPFGTLTCIHESAFQFGKLIVGSDDGLVHLSVDNGYTWTNITSNLPKDAWVSEVYFSRHEKNTLYAVLNKYRNDDFSPLLFTSSDNGKSWNSIANNLPSQPLNAFKEDHRNGNILYVGADNGLFFSLDKGKTWQLFNASLPSVAVHDLAIQEKENDLIIGTHGRSVWIGEIEFLDLLANSTASLEVIQLDTLIHNTAWGESWSKWLAPEDPTHPLVLLTNKSEELTLELYFKNLLISTQQVKATKGLTYIDMPIRLSKEQSQQLAIQQEKDWKEKDNARYYLQPGNYLVKIKSSDRTVEKELIVKGK